MIGETSPTVNEADRQIFDGGSGESKPVTLWRDEPQPEFRHPQRFQTRNKQAEHKIALLKGHWPGRSDLYALVSASFVPLILFLVRILRAF